MAPWLDRPLPSTPTLLWLFSPFTTTTTTEMTPATSAFVSHSMSLRGLEMPFLLFVVKMCCAQNRKKYQVEKGNLTHTSSWWRFIPERGCRELPYLVKLLVLCVYPPATWKKPTANSPSSCFYKRICWFFVSSFSPPPPNLFFQRNFVVFI